MQPGEERRSQALIVSNAGPARKEDRRRDVVGVCGHLEDLLEVAADTHLLVELRRLREAGDALVHVLKLEHSRAACDNSPRQDIVLISRET